LIKLTATQKESLARIVRLPPVRTALALAVKVLVARHRTGVTVVCFNHAKQVLLLRHVFHPATPWDLPGGWLERDESPAECVLRELREETGLKAELGPVIRLSREEQPAHISITYLARLNGSMAATTLSSEILESRWFAPDKLPEKIRASTRLAVELAVSQLPQWNPLERVSDV
jgi:ADP-ribose pyrophosphatase YjhB (NUDIX family)